MKKIIRNGLAWVCFLTACGLGSLLLLVAGIQGTIFLWGRMIEWGL